MASESKKGMNYLSVVNLNEWIATNKSSFAPPVCNKLMFGRGELKVMFIGGPNIRKDYHLEEGEELFFQIEGKMCLESWEKNKQLPLNIEEGEIFVLPGYFCHSPQRFENTVGLVIERERKQTELDVLRWYQLDKESGKPLPGKILYQENFHCVDLGSQLVPVIKRYFASDSHRTGQPVEKVPDTPIKENTTDALDRPQSLEKLLSSLEAFGGEKHRLQLFNAREFKVVASMPASDPLGKTTLKHEKLVWLKSNPTQEKVVLSIFGESPQTLNLSKSGDLCLIPANLPHSIETKSEKAVVIEIWVTPDNN
mmetsp:Transcript_16808/g.25107  ORF Transcript_16808/g.25107 Transcript_16808/m.25107 type:complete len:310 (+) Transcript_16808:19-948(+)